MRSVFPAALTMLSLIALGGTAGAATTYYVATTGADTAACGTSAAPCRNVQTALDKTDDGDMVLVRSGTYTECVLPSALNFRYRCGPWRRATS